MSPMHSVKPGESIDVDFPHGEEPRGGVGRGLRFAPRRVGGFRASWGVVGAFVLVAVVFTLVKPDAFTSIQTWQTLLEQASIPAIVAMGLTVALASGTFDLSIGAAIGLVMAIAAALMAHEDVSWPAAVALALAVGAVIGLANGLLVARIRVNSFIATLAMASILAGLEAKISGQESITQGIPASFDVLTQESLLGMSNTFWIAVVTGVLLFVAVAHTEAGRYLYAVGGNSEAARLSGVPVSRIQIAGLIVSAVCAGLAGVLLASQSASYFPGAGVGFLLPAFAGAFLGTALGRGRFGIASTAFGVLFLQLLDTGLSVLNVETWVVLVLEGVVVIVAVVVSRLGHDAEIVRGGHA